MHVTVGKQVRLKASHLKSLHRYLFRPFRGEERRGSGRRYDTSGSPVPSPGRYHRSCDSEYGGTANYGKMVGWVKV